MSAAPDRPVLLPCNPDNIPEEMRRARRWAPWAAPWDEEKKKYGKVPHRADRPSAGLSNGSTSGWVTFEQAMASYRANPHLFAGVGYLMTGAHGVVGVDLDNCVKDGVVAPWAATIIAKLDSYTELSPSGTGLHVMLSGDLESDWSVKLGPLPHTSKSPGIDVYGGGARFLTVTGAQYPGSPRALRQVPGALDALAARYRKSKDAGKLHVLPLPDTYAMEVPHIAELSLPTRVVDFLTDGPEVGADRSSMLISTGVALAAAGLSPEEAFALMVSNDHVMGIALDKRQYDDTKAREYLWTHHCRRGAAIVDAGRALTMADFIGEDAPAEILAQKETVADDFECMDDFADVLGEAPAAVVKPRDLSPVKKAGFTFQSVDEFLNRAPPSWIIKGLLPRAALGLIYGDSGTGKTFVALDQAMAVALGLEWRGGRTKQGKVAYIVAEGATGFQDRISAYCQAHGVDRARLPLRILAAAPNMMNNKKDAPGGVADLCRALQKEGPLAAIYVDTYARVMGEGNENEAKDTNLVIAHCALLHELTGAIVILIHHSGKNAANGARGSGALRAAADVEYAVAKATGRHTFKVTKMKDGEDGKSYAFRLNSVTIGMDEDGDTRTSCTVEHMAEVPSVQDQLAEAHEKPYGEVQTRILAHLGTYIGGEVGYEQFVQDVREITPLPASGVESSNWKILITKPLNKLIAAEKVVKVGDTLRLPKIACD